MSGNLVEFKPFKFIFLQIRFDFFKKSYNIVIKCLDLGSRMQIRYTHKLSVHKADFSQNGEVCAKSLRTQPNFLKFEAPARYISRLSNQNYF